MTAKCDCRADGRTSDDVRYRTVSFASSWSSSSDGDDDDDDDDDKEEEEEGIFITSIQNCRRFGRVCTS